MSTTTIETMDQFPTRRMIGQRGRKQFDAIAAELQAALTREQMLLNDKHELSQRQVMLEHQSGLSSTGV